MSEQTVLDLDAARERKKTSRRQRQEERSEPFPEPLSQEAKVKILELAKLDGFSFAQTAFATRTVKYWAEGGNRQGKIVVKTRWPQTIVNAMRLGWGLRGFDQWRRLQQLSAWKDRPLRNFLFQDLVTCVDRRSRGIMDFVPRPRVETVEDSRLT